MSYFSRVRVLPRALPEALRRVAAAGDAYRDHAWLWSLFPTEPTPRDFVFRTEREEGGGLFFYLVSKRMPNAEAPGLSVESKPYQPRLVAGERVCFELRANPTVAVRCEGRERSVRHDVLMHAKRQASSTAEAVERAAREWVEGRASSWGLELESASLRVDAYTQHRLRKGGRQIYFSSVDYAGTAIVSEPERLQEALVRGVGHSKAFGCGLLLVRRLG